MKAYTTLRSCSTGSELVDNARAMASDPKQWHVGLVGYGEVGRILAEDLRAQGVAVSAYDLKLDAPATAEALAAHARIHGVGLAASHAELAARADFIVSAVTASQAAVCIPP